MNHCKDCILVALNEDACLYCVNMIPPFWGPPQVRFKPQSARKCAVCGEEIGNDNTWHYCPTTGNPAQEWGIQTPAIDAGIVREIDQILRGDQ